MSLDTVSQFIQTLYTGKGNQPPVQLQSEFCEKVDWASVLTEMSQVDNHNFCFHPKTRLRVIQRYIVSNTHEDGKIVCYSIFRGC